MGNLVVGRSLRYARPYNSKPVEIDDLPNYFNLTQLPGDTLPLLERGINQIRPVVAPDGRRPPAILISSSPHKHGSDTTPWRDVFEPNQGFVRYYGDNKTNGIRPEKATGNAILLEQFSIHNSADHEVRALAVPLIFFQRAQVGERVKGNVTFQGFGVISAAELVTQINPKSKETFSNYVFEMAVFGMANEGETFDWDWVNSRRDPTLTIERTLIHAPKTWQRWIREGPIAIEKCRRRVISFRTISQSDQRPAAGTNEHRTLVQIYQYFERKRHRFENFASLVAANLIQRSGGTYHEEWLSRASGDGGFDFVGRLDVGLGVSSTRVIVLGQAKCESPSVATNGKDIARLVARLRRGWLGVYVTTSYFSEAVQREVNLDRYPVILIPGKVVAEVAQVIAAQRGYDGVQLLLAEIDSRYETLVRNRDPEEVYFGI